MYLADDVCKNNSVRQLFGESYDRGEAHQSRLLGHSWSVYSSGFESVWANFFGSCVAFLDAWQDPRVSLTCLASLMCDLDATLTLLDRL
jgi:hypothetical protein